MSKSPELPPATPVLHKCPHPGCDAAYTTTHALGTHMRKHGLQSQTPSAIKKREARLKRLAKTKASKTPATPPPPPHTSKPESKGAEPHAVPRTPDNVSIVQTLPAKRPYTRREQQQAPQQSQGPSREVILAVALGRFTEFCNTLAREYNQPSRDFTHALVETIRTSQMW